MLTTPKTTPNPTMHTIDAMWNMNRHGRIKTSNGFVDNTVSYETKKAPLSTRFCQKSWHSKQYWNWQWG
eukprot:m.1020258 g.1020258  ORF g.1020258 m.1020258 type:complete len:69 (-) comp24087_c0_seq74:1405-1611(-)